MRLKPDAGSTRTLVMMTIVRWPYAYPPSVREIADEIGLGVSATHAHLEALRRDGMIDWEPGLARTIRSNYVEATEWLRTR